MGESPPTPLWRRLTVRRLLWGLPFYIVAVSLPDAVRDNSFLWHVRAGTAQLDGGRVLLEDPFSFTHAGMAWRTQSWLVELGYGVLEEAAAGLGWVSVLELVTIGLVLVAVTVAVHRARPHWAAAPITMVGLAFLLVPFLAPRPVLVSYLLLALVALAVRRPVERWWPIPLLIWVWAASHGSFVIGLGLVVLETLRRGRKAWRPGGQITALGILAASVTAHGLGIWEVLVRFLSNREALAFIREWAPPDLTSFPILLYAAALVALLAGAALGKIRLADLWVVAPFAIFGLTSNRALAPAAIVLAPWVAAAIGNPAEAEVRAAEPALRAAVNWAVVMALVAVAAVQVPWSVEPDPERFPVAAAGRLQPGPAFHDDVTGGYLIYVAWPDRQVFIDDRAELYGAEFFDRFRSIRSAGGDWEEVFGEYGIDQALLRVDEPLATVLPLAGWLESYRDDHFTVLRRP